MLPYPQIDPVAIALGPLKIHWYGLMYLVGIGGAWLLASRRLKDFDPSWSKEKLSDLVFWVAMGVILGGRLGYALFYDLSAYLAEPLKILRVWEGGMSFHGGLIGVMLATWLFGRRNGKSFFQLMDFIAPLVPIGLGAGRIGNFINAELWGKVTDVFLPNSVQIDLNMGLDPAFRWSSQQGTKLEIGGHVEGIRLQNGVLKTSMDTFIHDEQHPMVMPFEVNFSAQAAANATFKPASVTGVAASDASSTFSASRAGNYYYAVAGIGPNGEGMSQVTKSAQIAVAAGNKVTLTITASAANTETGYAIYRSRQNGTNTTNDFRLVKVIKKAGDKLEGK